LKVEVRYLDAAGGWATKPLGKVDAHELVRGKSARAFPTYKGQRNYPGLLCEKQPEPSGAD
jgi:hypothetical protein